MATETRPGNSRPGNFKKPAPRYDTADLNKRLDACELFERHTGLTGRPVSRGRQYPNPRLPQKTGSFTVYHEGGFHDFATGEHGSDSLALLAYLHGLDVRADFRRVLDLAAVEAGVSLVTLPPIAPLPKPPPLKTPPAPPAVIWQTAMREAVQQAETTLWRAPGAALLHYLRQRLDAGRGLPRERIDTLIRTMRLGGLVSSLPTAVRTEDRPDRPIKVPSGLILPWFDPDGQLTALQVRLDDQAAARRSTPRKYEFVRGSKPTAACYLVGQLFDPTQPAVITESVLKAAAVKLDYPDWNCIGMGSATYALTPAMVEQLRGCPAVYLAMDNDPHPETGRNPGQEAQTHLAAQIGTPNVRLCLIPFGKDPDGYLQEDGSLADLFAAATPYLPAIAPDPLRALPDGWRTALNRYAPAGVAPTLEVLVEAQAAGLLDLHQGVTADQVIQAASDLGRACSSATLRRGLCHGARWEFLAISDTNSFLQLDNSPMEDKVSEIAKKPTRGRPRLVYHTSAARVRTAILDAARRAWEDELAARDRVVPPLTPYHLDDALADEHADPNTLHPEAKELAVALHTRHGAAIQAQPGHDARERELQRRTRDLEHALDRQVSSPLPSGWVYRNGRDYRACFLRALADADQITDLHGKSTDAPGNRRLAALVGTSRGNVVNVARQAGLDLRERYREVAAPNPAYLRGLSTYDNQVEGAPLHAKFGDGSGGAWANPAVREEAIRRRSQGETVSVVYQLASRIAVVSEAQPPPVPPRPRPPAATYPTAQPAPTPGMRHGVRVLLRLLVLVSAWRLQGDQLHDKGTGELVPFSPRTLIDLLLGKPPPAIQVDPGVLAALENVQATDKGERQLALFEDAAVPDVQPLTPATTDPPNRAGTGNHGVETPPPIQLPDADPHVPVADPPDQGDADQGPRVGGGAVG